MSLFVAFPSRNEPLQLSLLSGHSCFHIGGQELQYSMNYVDTTVALYHQEIIYNVYLSQQPI